MHVRLKKKRQGREVSVAWKIVTVKSLCTCARVSDAKTRLKCVSACVLADRVVIRNCNLSRLEEKNLFATI